MSIRLILLEIRRRYNADRKKFYRITGIITAIGIVLGLLADMFVPWTLWGYCVRMAAMLITVVPGFALAYGVSLDLHQAQVRNNPQWVPYRMRFSVKVRRYIAIIIAAILLVIGTNPARGVGYTLMSSVIVCLLAAVVSFASIMTKERELQMLDIQDPRDRKLDQSLYERRLEVSDRMSPKSRHDAKKKKKAQRKAQKKK